MSGPEYSNDIQQAWRIDTAHILRFSSLPSTPWYQLFFSLRWSKPVVHGYILYITGASATLFERFGCPKEESWYLYRTYNKRWTSSNIRCGDEKHFRHFSKGSLKWQTPSEIYKHEQEDDDDAYWPPIASSVLHTLFSLSHILFLRNSSLVSLNALVNSKHHQLWGVSGEFRPFQ